MVEVILKDIEKQGKKYSITVGNGCYFEFNSLKKAKAFNVELSKFLTKRVLILNELHTELFTICRKQWVIAENRGRAGISHFLHYKEINDSINNITFWLDFLVSPRCHSPIYSFICIQKVCREIDSVCTRVVENTSSLPVYQYAVSLQKNLYVSRSLLSEVRNYGLNDCTKIVNIERFNDFDRIITGLSIAL